MNQGQVVFAQIAQHLPLTTFRRCVAKYGGEHKVKSFYCLDQCRCMAFAQLTFRESLRDIEACLRAQITKLYRLIVFAQSAGLATRVVTCAGRSVIECLRTTGRKPSRMGCYGCPVRWVRGPAVHAPVID